MASYGYDLDDDFEAQLAAMEQEIDSQYQASLSSRSQEPQQAFTADPLHTIPANPSTSTKSSTINTSTIDNDSLDHISISLTDIDSDAETDFGDDEPLFNNDKKQQQQHQQKHNHDDDQHHGHSHNNGHGHSHGGNDEDDYENSIQAQLDEKFRLEEEEAQRQWDEDVKLYQTDPTLSGFIFNEDLAGFKKALASGRHRIDEFDFKGEHTALHHAVFHEELSFIRELMEHKCDVNIRNFRGETPLMLACKLEDGLPLLSVLIDQYNADIHAKDNVGLHAFHHAAEQGRVYHLALLHTIYGVDVNIVDIYNKNALHWAGWAGHLKACEWLLRHGCSPYQRDHIGCYPLHWAAAKSRDKVLGLFAAWDASDATSFGGIKTVAEQTYMKQVRKLKFGDRFDFNKSPFVNNPSSTQIDPNLQQQITSRKKFDRNTLTKFVNDELYDDFNTTNTNPIDGISVVKPSEFADYKTFNEMLATKNKDGYDVRGFLLFKNESLTGVDRYYVNATLKALDRLSYTAFWSSPLTKGLYIQFQRTAYLPFHYLVCYMLSLFAVLFVIQPVYQTYFPQQYWLIWLFYIFWVLAMYNWYRLVFTTPAKLDIFTPATKSLETFGDDGSSTLSKDVPMLSSPTTTNTTNSPINDQPSPRIVEDSCTDSVITACSIDICNEPNHKLPIQRFTIKEYQSISTLYTLFVDLMVSGQANESNTCYTCEIAKPLRSKHCPRCNRCVPRFDHHCPFFNQDIAYTNYHNFLWFLILVPIHWVIFMVIYFKLSHNGLLTVETLPPYYFTFMSIFCRPSIALLLLRIFIIHLFIYIIADIMLLIQHFYLLVDGITTNEAINRGRYSYLAISGVEWNPFSRGGFWSNVISALGLSTRFKEPLCLNDDQCKAIGYSKSPLSSSWADKVKRKTKTTKPPRV